MHAMRHICVHSLTKLSVARTDASKYKCINTLSPLALHLILLFNHCKRLHPLYIY